jgi:hypothetical protein
VTARDAREATRMNSRREGAFDMDKILFERRGVASV